LPRAEQIENIGLSFDLLGGNGTCLGRRHHSMQIWSRAHW
jgi:hypothetical protein